MAKNKFKHWKNKYELAKININIGKHEYTLARNKYNYMFLKLKNICKRICRQSQNIVGVGNNKHIAGQIHGRDTALKMHLSTNKTYLPSLSQHST